MPINLSKIYVPGEGIEHIHRVNEKLLSCGHSAGFGLGHIPACGHAVCALCVERYVLECCREGCFKKLCTVRGCVCCARSVEGVFYCKTHSIMAVIGSISGNIFLSRTDNEQRIICRGGEYYSRRIQLRGEK